jgi:hypothetical protein
VVNGLLRRLTGPYREGSARSKLTVLDHVERRTVEGREQLGVSMFRSPTSEPADPQFWRETTMLTWIDAATYLPMAAEDVIRDRSGGTLIRWRAEYAYDLDLPEDWFSFDSLLAGGTVLVGWEHLRELSEGEAIASGTARVGDKDVVVEVRGVEALPRDHVLIVASVGRFPRWLGAHLIRQEGRNYSSYSLVWQRPIGLGPWGAGGGPPPPFAMVFAPEGRGSRGVSVPGTRLTWRAWGLFQYRTSAEEASGDQQWQEDDVVFKLTLPLPGEAPVAHELARSRSSE